MEELLTTEPGPPKGAKPVNGIAKTIAPPAGAKKKEPTVSEPDSNDGTTQTGSVVSQEPGPKGAKPLKKSTAQDRYNERQKNLLTGYQSKFSQEIEPVIKQHTDLYNQELAAKQKEIQDKVNSGAVNVDTGNKELQDWNTIRADQLNSTIDETQKTLLPEFLKKNQKDISKWNAIYGQQFEEEDFKENKVRNPLQSAWTMASETLTKDLPSAAYGTTALMGSAYNKLDSEIDKQISKIPVSESFSEKASTFIKGGLEKVFGEGAGELQTKITTDQAGKKLVIDNFRKAIDLSDQSTESKKYLVNSLEKVKGGDFVDYLNYVGSAVGQGLGQIPASIGTKGTTSLIQEMGSIYLDSVKKIAEEQGITWEQVIEQGKDDVVYPMITGIAAGLLDAYGANKLNPFGKQEVLNSFRKRALALGKVVGSETVTEGAQGALENVGVSKAAGESWGDTLTKFNWNNVAESALQGGIASLFLGGGGQAINKTQNALKKDQLLIAPGAFKTTPIVKSPSQVVAETRTSVQSSNDLQGASQAADKILETTTIPEDSTGETSVTEPENKSPISQVGEGNVISEETEAEGSLTNKQPKLTQETPTIETVGTNYQKVNGEWQVKQADGSWAPIISKNPNKTTEEQNELTQLKELKRQLDEDEPQNLKMSNTEKGRIAQLEPTTVMGAVRKFFWDGGQVLWNSKGKTTSKPQKGIKDEGGLSQGDKKSIEQFVNDTHGFSVGQIAEKLAQQGFDEMEARNAVIEVLSQTDPKNWHEDHLKSEDPDYLQGRDARFDEANEVAKRIEELETQEKGITETNQQLYENERRVNRGSEEEGAGTAERVAGEKPGEQGEGGQTQAEPISLIRENGNEDQSQQALEELGKLNLTHVTGLGMGQNQAKGTYVSTESENRYATEENEPKKVTVKVNKPFVTDSNIFATIQRAIIQSRFGKNAIEDLTDNEVDLLAEMVNEHFVNEGYDSIYFPQSESQEGELIVFDKNNVEFTDEATVKYKEAVHEAMQTKLSLEFIPDENFLKTDKPVELRERQKKIKKDLARLNQLIKCK